jgi:hypothetical protein
MSKSDSNTRIEATSEDTGEVLINPGMGFTHFEFCSMP